MPEKRRKFDAEFREGAVRLVRQRRGAAKSGPGDSRRVHAGRHRHEHDVCAIRSIAQ